MRDRLKKCSKHEPKPLDNHKHSQENCNHQSQQIKHEDSNVFIDVDNSDIKESQITLDGVTKHISENVNSLTDEKRNHQTTFKDNHLEDIEVKKDFSISIVHNQSIKNHTNNDKFYSQANPGRLITLMFLLEAGRLDSSDINAQLESSYCRKLSAMASFFVNVSSDLQEAFFLFRNFTKKLEGNEALNTSQINQNKT